MSTSHKLFLEAQQYIPGGVNSPVRAWRAVGGDPLFIQRGRAKTRASFQTVSKALTMCGCA
ncbi:MAG: hypothetical protein HOP18_01820 [Deltaproteobacteria bacterium]|nr:hypothetical protein [Deltaproteobacteria bacterium]